MCLGFLMKKTYFKCKILKKKEPKILYGFVALLFIDLAEHEEGFGVLVTPKSFHLLEQLSSYIIAVTFYPRPSGSGAGQYGCLTSVKVNSARGRPVQKSSHSTSVKVTVRTLFHSLKSITPPLISNAKSHPSIQN